MNSALDRAIAVCEIEGQQAEADAVRALVAAATLALHEMCNTVAPRNSFTDAVDALDAALHNQQTEKVTSGTNDDKA